MKRRFAISLMAGVFAATPVLSQEYAGPLLPHVGLRLSTAFSNNFGPDAESNLTFTAVTAEAITLDYNSTRGLFARRTIPIKDREGSRTYVLGFAANMPVTIPGTTSLGISGRSLAELRTTGRTPLSLVHDNKMSRLDGELRLVAKDIRLPLIVENQLTEVPVVHAQGVFAAPGGLSGTAELYFLDNKNNPMMLQSTIRFSWEKQPRMERITSVYAGASMRSAMEQALGTLRRYDLYGIHFDFEKATIRPDAASLIDDIATTLKNNPTWRLQINGHTDSIGDDGFNSKLSKERAASVKAAIVARGVSGDRLETAGLGETKPKGDNGTLEGRAVNRRVELVRLDR